MPAVARRLTLLALAGALTVGCGNDEEEPAPTAPRPAPVAGAAVGPGTAQVVLRSGRFVPARVRARAGDVVVWTNADKVSYVVTARSGARFASPRLRPRGTYTFRVSAPGRIRYTARGRRDMRGEIEVSR